MSSMFVVTISDIIGLSMLALFLIVSVILRAITAWEQWRCPHDKGVNETRACHAICRSCSKDLGFISTWRKSQKEARP